MVNLSPPLELLSVIQREILTYLGSIYPYAADTATIAIAVRYRYKHAAVLRNLRQLQGWYYVKGWQKKNKTWYWQGLV